MDAVRFLLKKNITAMAKDEMIEGYFDGFRDFRAELPKLNNYSPAYKHGWLNGRDDRISKPRDRADVLRKRAEMILRES